MQRRGFLGSTVAAVLALFGVGRAKAGTRSLKGKVETRPCCRLHCGPAMTVTLGEEGLQHTWQAPFPKTTSCCRCGGEARIGFVAHELNPSSGPHVCNLHPNEYHEGSAWLHDSCAVAVYFCRKCLETTALYNQG